MEWLYIVAAYALLCLIIWVVGRFADYRNARTMDRVWNAKSKWDELAKERGNLAVQRSQVEACYSELAKDWEAVRTIAAEKSKGFPWLATVYADYFQLREGKVVDWLDTKKHPAKKAAEKVREMSRRRRKAERLWRMFRYQLEYYEALFPWLVDFKDVDSDDLIRSVLEGGSGGDDEEDVDFHAKKYLTDAEYKALPSAEKYQLALDRYRAKKKKNWEIGRDYERYVGYFYEKGGYRVRYQGIVEGLRDLGRDIIASRGNRVEIVQCKCWSKHKTIHEKHIFQLYGTTVEYWLKHRHESPDLQSHLFPELLHKELVGATFFTSTTVSDLARAFAEVLKVRIIENQPLRDYPCIKCNVNRATGEKIYHLPFDQQYDNVYVEPLHGECYVETVAEAEALGFRRAFRWRGNREES